MKTARLLLIALCLMLLIIPAAAEEAQGNLLKNGGFEQMDDYGDPVDWYATSYRPEEGYSRLTIANEVVHSGHNAVSIENASMNDARFVTTVKVKPNTLYRMSGYVYVDHMNGVGNGANFAIEGIYAFSVCLFDTDNAWQYLEWYGRTGADQTELTLGVRVGGYSGESTGKAYFDDIVLEEVDAAPEDITPAVWFTVDNGSNATATADTTPTKGTVWFVALALLFMLLYHLCRPLFGKADVRGSSLAFGAVMLLALAIRIVLGLKVSGYEVDINCFTAWSLRMAQNGPAGFYAPDYFCDYPPGYMLLLWPIGLLLKALGSYSVQADSIALLLVKSLPILCDMLGAILLYIVGKKKLGGIPAAFVAGLYALSPAVLVNGAAWGQADSVLALFLMLCVLTAVERKWQFALPIYALAVLLKPQALLFAPIAGAWLLYTLFRQGQDKRTKELLMGVGSSILVFLAVVIPFSIRQEQPVGWLVELYRETLGSYSYATLNTANLYYLLGANWTSLTLPIGWTLPTFTALAAAGLGILCVGKEWKNKPKLNQRNIQLALVFLLFAVYQLGLAVFGASYELYGYGMMALVYALVSVCMLHDAKPVRLAFYLALALIGIYVFGIKVHERYLFPALALLLLSALYTHDRRMLLLFAGFSATTFINTAIVLDNSILFGSSMGHLNDDTLALNIILCIANLLLTGYAAWVAFKPDKPERELLEGENEQSKADEAFKIPDCYQSMLLHPKDARLHLTLKDWLIMGVVTVLYGVLAFTNLGSTVAPQDGWVSSSPDEQIVFELPENQPFYFMYYAGVSYNSFSISVSDDGINWSADFPCEMRQGLCYRWNYALQSDTGVDGNVVYADNSPIGKLLLSGKYLRLNAELAGLNLFEIALRDEAGQTIPLTIAQHIGANPAMLDNSKPAECLINEQDTCVGEPGWYTGTYFDEIYHARTAYEHLHGQVPYETTHPPLGKLLMAIGIAIFGMTPFGWRFAGAFIGVLMLPALYLLAKQLFKRRDLATLSMTAFALDLMHYTQTRIATIDSFPVFFIVLSYLCMVRYMQTDMFAVADNQPPCLLSKAFWRSLIPLALCGLFMGLSIASKWIGLYSAVGLAVLFFSAVYRQYRAGNYAYCYLAHEQKALNDNQHSRIKTAQDFTLKRILITCGFCVIFFVVVPGLIYYLSYIPYLSPNGPVTLRRVIQAQEGMLSYHSTPGLGMDHPFQSPWWQWPFILKPIWFSQDKFEPQGMASTIMCMGNPWVFYIGAICMVMVVIALVCKHFKCSRNGVEPRRGDGDLTLYTLVVGFAAQYLPWVLVPRSMYMYHYFASVPFIILATAWVISLIPKERKRLTISIIACYLIGAAAFFVMFFPYASGWLTDIEWLDAMKWFSKLYY